MVYWRSWVDNEGVPQFRDDIYDFDADATMVNNAVLKSIVGHS
jgi:murein L,D-transpeptidase YcbB/YkuD